MSYLEDLITSVSEKVSAGQLGEPVFARLMLAVSDDRGRLLPAAAEGVALVVRIMQVPLRTVFASGDVQSGHLSVQLELEPTATALVSVAMLRGSAPRVDLLLVGNHGTLCHESRAETLKQIAEGAALFEATSEDQQLQGVLSESLSRGVPVSTRKRAR